MEMTTEWTKETAIAYFEGMAKSYRQQAIDLVESVIQYGVKRPTETADLLNSLKRKESFCIQMAAELHLGIAKV
jgi:hypothetical protein